MTITLTANLDPTLRTIAEFLFEQLNALDSDIVVQQVSDLDVVAFAQPADFPLLQLYRLGSKGRFLETSELQIEYYLQDPSAYAERPGMLRLVEVAIAHLLDKIPFHGLSDQVVIRAGELRCDRGFLKIEDAGLILPYTRLQVPIQEVNVDLPEP